MALKGIKVLELSGLAPAPFCGNVTNKNEAHFAANSNLFVSAGMVLTDFGATVTKIDRAWDNPVDVLTDGKRKLAINIKHTRGQEIVRKLSGISDVLIEPYRPGVMEKLNLGPDSLMRDNPRLIYARLTGFGQTGPLAQRAGHDINYVALSGVLSFCGQAKQPPQAPVNLIADFAGGGLLCAFGICAALVERHRSGKGQIVDSAMSEGAAYVGSWLMRSQSLPVWQGPRGTNMLDGGAFFYGTYETSDGQYMSVGALESQFFAEFTRILGLQDVCEQFDNDTDRWRREIEVIFKSKTQREWTELFQDLDACVFPVLDWREADRHPHNIARNNFVPRDQCDGVVVPQPAPRLSRTPAVSGATAKRATDSFQQTVDILKEIGFDATEVQQLCAEGAINLPNAAKL